MKNQHTPGPWEIKTDAPRTAINAGVKHIAMVNWYNSPDPNQTIIGEENEANARLIAKAWLIPDLLEVLKRAHKYVFHVSKDSLNKPQDYADYDLLDEIETTIAKTEEEPTK